MHLTGRLPYSAADPVFVQPDARRPQLPGASARSVQGSPPSHAVPVPPPGRSPSQTRFRLLSDEEAKATRGGSVIYDMYICPPKGNTFCPDDMEIESNPCSNWNHRGIAICKARSCYQCSVLAPAKQRTCTTTGATEFDCCEEGTGDVACGLKLMTFCDYDDPWCWCPQDWPDPKFAWEPCRRDCRPMRKLPF